MGDKRLATARADATASANRIAFGVSKDAKARARAERALDENRLEAHRRAERPDGD
jgi:hypothetical protein